MILGAALAAALTACAAQDELPVFSQPQEEHDRLPSDGTSHVIESVDEATTRLLWEDEAGTSFYAARGRGDSDGYSCLLIFTGGEGQSACGGLPVTISPSGEPSYMLSPMVDGNSDEWTQVADNLFVANDEAHGAR
ncbi:hypothetical protein ACEXQD_06510 [Herbiconiux sp. P15]|uniref:hypothetical protein n=1 Tax=Herbiconiux liukaitaii TaxID=3342799 RepID=UPI0035B94A29